MKYSLKCDTVSISIKYSNFLIINRQIKVNSTNLFQNISKAATDLFNLNYNGEKIRAITISVTDLKSNFDEMQLSFFDNEENRNIKLEKVVKKIDDLQLLYGKNKINFGSVLK